VKLQYIDPDSRQYLFDSGRFGIDEQTHHGDKRRQRGHYGARLFHIYVTWTGIMKH
jgi:hypothetical protein